MAPYNTCQNLHQMGYKGQAMERRMKNTQTKEWGFNHWQTKARNFKKMKLFSFNCTICKRVARNLADLSCVMLQTSVSIAWLICRDPHGLTDIGLLYCQQGDPLWSQPEKKKKESKQRCLGSVKMIVSMPMSSV